MCRAMHGINFLVSLCETPNLSFIQYYLYRREWIYPFQKKGRHKCLPYKKQYLYIADRYSYISYSLSENCISAITKLSSCFSIVKISGSIFLLPSEK